MTIKEWLLKEVVIIKFPLEHLYKNTVKENRLNFGEVDVAPVKNDKINTVEKWQQLTAGLNPNHMHIFKPWKKEV